MKRYTLLVVDDEVRSLELLERTLIHDHKVYTAINGQEALKIMNEKDIHLVITDQRMPGMSGVQFLEQTLDQHPQTIRIILTGYTDIDALVDAINTGQVYRYINKPWDPKELRSIVKQALEHFELTEENRRLLNDLTVKNAALEETLEKLKATQAELLDAERLSTVGKMANMIIHDFKNPLTSIKGFTQMIATYPLPDDKKKHYLKIINEEIDRLVGMAEELLEFSRGSFREIQPRPNHVREFIEEMMLFLESHFVEKEIGIRIDLGFSSELPFDREKLKRVFYNIAINAKEAMSTGGRLTISTIDQGDDVEFRIEDTGGGVPAEILETIFEPFITGKKRGGTGLGLSITKKIIECHSGRLWVENRPGDGATFCFTLPKTTPEQSS